MATVKSSFKYGLLTFLLLFIGAQFLPVDRTNPPVEEEIPAPPGVKAILKRACFDCHSNQTRWPWYSRVAPFSWLVAHDVQEGREELNLSLWNRYPDDKKAKKIKEIVEEVEEGEMPPRLYLWLHSDAALDAKDRGLLKQWAIALAEQSGLPVDWSGVGEEDHNGTKD